jgi:aminopeptidase N
MRPLLAALAALALTAAPAGAQDFQPGSQSLGDPLLPQIGNGGYDVRHYAIDLRYDPATNRLEPGTHVDISAVATQDLSRFSLDFQRDLAISAVTVDGGAASIARRNAKPRLSERRKVTQPAKLIVTPAAGITEGTQFTVTVEYSGEPRPVVDADRSSEGWIRACSRPGECDGSFTVNQPIGTQGWLPCNNYATDKATVETRITAPSTHVALGAGELAAREDNPDGTTTWTWSATHPAAPYLLSATVGRFDLEIGTMSEEGTGRSLPVYDAIDSAAPEGRRTQVQNAIDRAPGMLNFLAKRLGPYPFGSIGTVADWVPAVGYALENQTKPHFAGDEGGPVVQHGVLLHEILHQWMGDSVSARRWTDLWFNEGWATFSEIYWESKFNDEAESPRRFFQNVVRSRPENFELAPAILDGDPANLFDGFATYSRPGAMIQGYRQIVGNRRFFDFARQLTAEHAYGTISRGAFIRKARAASGLRGRESRRLGAYFRQWLLWEKKPSLRPSDFR